jgi:tetratricopeptide (TPR) repeat protein
MLTKLPVAVLVAAALIMGAAVIGQSGQTTRSTDPVARAIYAGFTDVGIPPVETSLAFWQQRVNANPSDYLSKTSLAGTIMAQAKDTGDLSLYPKAEAILHEALALNPIDDGTLLALAGARGANHDFTGAMALAEQVLARKPESQAAKVVVADANFELGNYDLAARQLRELVALLPAGLGLDSRLAKEAALDGRIDEAIRYASDGVVEASDLDLRPSEAAFYRFQLAHFLYQAGRMDEAAATLESGLRIDPRHLASLELKGQVLVAQGRLTQAASLYEALVQRTPAADLHGLLAKVYRGLGRTAEADAQVALGLKLGHVSLRTYPAERRHLAGFFADVEPATALEAAEADFGTRHDVGAYDTLAWAYFRNGRVADAARYLDGALARGTKDATLLYHASMIERAVGRSTEAARHLRQALALNPRVATP